MTEAEIVYQISETYNRVWSIQQWWASVSFGLLIVAHVASDRLNGLLVALMSILYTVFSVYLYTTMATNGDVASAFVKDLEVLEKSGVSLAQGSSAYTQNWKSSSAVLVLVTLGGTYLAANAYLIFCYIKHRN